MAELIALPPQIATLEAGGYIAQPEGTVEITENGTYNVKPYANADVNVQPDLGTLDITENGTYSASTYDKAGFEEVTVDVQPDLIEKTITSNGAYTASDDGVDGYSKAIVDIPIQEQKTVVVTKGDEPTTIVPDSGYTSMKEVNASVSLTSTTFTPSKSRQTRTPAQGVAGFSKAICLPTPLESKTITPTTQQQVVTPTAPNIGFDSVTVEGVPKDAFALQLENNLIEYTVTDDVTRIREEGFGYIPRLQKVVFNNSYNITAIRLFHNCTSLLTCIFNNPQTLITNDMFWRCESLQEQICPSSVILIDRYAFEYCGSLTRIVLKAPVVCTLANVNAFFNTPFRNGTGGVAYVPQSLVSEYQNATNWSALESITFLPIEGSPYE